MCDYHENGSHSLACLNNRSSSSIAMKAAAFSTHSSAVAMKTTSKINVTFSKDPSELEPFTDSERMQLEEHLESLSSLLDWLRLDGKVYDADYISVIAGLRSIVAQTKPLNFEGKANISTDKTIDKLTATVYF